MPLEFAAPLRTASTRAIGSSIGLTSTGHEGKLPAAPAGDRWNFAE